MTSESLKMNRLIVERLMDLAGSVLALDGDESGAGGGPECGLCGSLPQRRAAACV
jgi:hypothetical protein